MLYLYLNKDKYPLGSIISGEGTGGVIDSEISNKITTLTNKVNSLTDKLDSNTIIAYVPRPEEPGDNPSMNNPSIDNEGYYEFLDPNIPTEGLFDISNYYYKIDKDYSSYSNYHYNNMTSLPSKNQQELTNIVLDKNAKEAIYQCRKLTSIPDSILITWDTSHVTNMYCMFCQNDVLKKLNLSSFDTRRVRNMYEMFWEDKELETIDFSENFNTSNVTNLRGTFWRCNKLKKTPNINTQNALITELLFGDCKELEYIGDENPISYFNLVNAENTECMFLNCEKLKGEIKLKNTSNIRNLSRMFAGCKSIDSISILDVSGTDDIHYLFYNCNNLVNLVLINTQNITNMAGTFANCTNLPNIPEMDTSNVITMNNTFLGCQGITTIPLLDTSNVTTMQGMFYGCDELINIPQLNTSNVTNMNSMFTGCEVLEEVPELDTSKVIIMAGMFCGCTKLPHEFPWPIDFSSIAALTLAKLDNFYAAYSDGTSTNSSSNTQTVKDMFKDSSVRKVQLKNVKSSLRSQITSELLKGDNTLEIEFID